MKPAQPKIHFLYTNIGRGHPFYLDGINEELIRAGRTGLIRGQTDVFDISHDVARWGWKAARWLYRTGSSSQGFVGRYYRSLRSDSDYNKDSFALRILGRDIRREFLSKNDPVVVAHPVLVAALRHRPELYYQHGEVVTPGEAVVKGSSSVFVPTVDAGRPFLEAGYTQDQVFVSGLCVEPALVRQANDAFAQRCQRFESDQPLTGAFFSSGAEPRMHIEKLLIAMQSLLSVGHRTMVFAAEGGKLAASVREDYGSNISGFAIVNHNGLFSADAPQLTLVEYRSRRELSILTAQYFPEFDFIVSPPHERTNWTLGLGLPMFIVGPAIGPFAPLNEAIMLSEPVTGYPLKDRQSAAACADTLHRLRLSGELLTMADNGWKRFDIDGFGRIADHLIARMGV
jgi:hypothetical protein